MDISAFSRPPCVLKFRLTSSTGLRTALRTASCRRQAQGLGAEVHAGGRKLLRMAVEWLFASQPTCFVSSSQGQQTSFVRQQPATMQCRPNEATRKPFCHGLSKASHSRQTNKLRDGVHEIVAINHRLRRQSPQIESIQIWPDCFRNRGPHHDASPHGVGCFRARCSGHFSHEVFRLRMSDDVGRALQFHSLREALGAWLNPRTRPRRALSSDSCA